MKYVELSGNTFRLGSKPVNQYCEYKKYIWVSQREIHPLRSVKQVKYQENI